jgi:hypothetical protein
MTLTFGTIDHTVEPVATARARHLGRLLEGLERGPRQPGPYPTADQVPVGKAAQVLVSSRGRDRVGEVAQVDGGTVTVDYLTPSSVRQARVVTAAYRGEVTAPGYADHVAERARRNAVAELVRWRKWSVVDPNELYDNERARLVWGCIEPGHEQAGPRSVSPGTAALMARSSALARLRQHDPTWPSQVYRRAYVAGYVRQRVVQMHPQNPWLAWVRVHRVSVACTHVRVIV